MSCFSENKTQLHYKNVIANKVASNKAVPRIKMPLRHHETQKIPLKHHETVWHDQHYNNPITSSR